MPGDPFGVSDVVGGLLGFEGSRRSNSAAHDMAQEQMRFQSDEAQKLRTWENLQTSTAWQRGVSDMQAAGINPMLAASKGGADSGSGGGVPGGAQAPVRNNFAEGMDMASRFAQVRLTSAQEAKTAAEKDLVVAQVPGAIAQAKLDDVTAEAWKYKLEHMFPSIADSTGFESDVKRTEAFEAKQKLNALGDPDARGGSVGSQVAKADLVGRMAESRSAVARALLEEAEVPGAQNRMRTDENFWGRNIRPYLGDVGKAVSGAAGAIGAASGLKYLTGGRGPGVIVRKQSGVRSEDIEGQKVEDGLKGGVFKDYDGPSVFRRSSDRLFRQGDAEKGRRRRGY